MEIWSCGYHLYDLISRIKLVCKKWVYKRAVCSFQKYACELTGSGNVGRNIERPQSPSLPLTEVSEKTHLESHSWDMPRLLQIALSTTSWPTILSLSSMLEGLSLLCKLLFSHFSCENYILQSWYLVMWACPKSLNRFLRNNRWIPMGVTIVPIICNCKWCCRQELSQK